MSDHQVSHTSGAHLDLLCYEAKEICLEGNEVNWENYSNCSDQGSDINEDMSFFATGIDSPFTEACPARWTTLQAVVSPGESPLPAEVRMKADAFEGNEFFGVDADEWTSEQTAQVTVYNRSSFHSRLRRLFSHAIVRTFAEMKYEFQPNSHYAPCFELHTDMMIDRIIVIVEDCLESLPTDYVTGVPVSIDETFRHCVRKEITTGYIAELCLDLTHSFRANKNWNWHGATVGASIGAIASLLSVFRQGILPKNFRQKIPKGVVLTGSKHGHHDVHYVEYMTAEIQGNRSLGTSENYLEHSVFVNNNHAERVMAIMDGKDDITVKPKGRRDNPRPHLKVFYHPTPRPTRAHTVDFAVTWMGVHLLDGECKDTYKESDCHVLVLHSLEQLAYKEEAVAMLTSSKNITIFSSRKERSTNTICTRFHKLPAYSLGQPADMDKDLYKDDAGITCVPTFHMQCPSQGSGDSSTATEVKEPVDSQIDVTWKSLRSEQRKFILCIMQCIDILCAKFESVDLEKVKNLRSDSFDMGFEQPRYWTTRQDELKSRREIPNPEQFLYNSENMENVMPTPTEESDESL